MSNKFSYKKIDILVWSAFIGNSIILTSFSVSDRKKKNQCIKATSALFNF